MNLMARELQRFSVSTAIHAGFGAPLLMRGLAIAVGWVQGRRLEADFVRRLSPDLSEEPPREKAA